MSLDENKAIVQRILKEFWVGGNIRVLDELLTDDCVNHEQSNPEIRGKQAYKEWADGFRLASRQGFPDYDVKAEDFIAEGDKVVKRWVFQGTQTGEFNGIPPTGRAVTMRGITVYRLAGGKVAETYWNYDVFGMLQQLGAIPAPGQQQPAGVSA
jgi:steroid delta-isomerase-like uncharacterized protein